MIYDALKLTTSTDCRVSESRGSAPEQRTGSRVWGLDVDGTAIDSPHRKGNFRNCGTPF